MKKTATSIMLQFVFLALTWGQNGQTDEYLKGMAALSKNNLIEAETYFRSSVINHKDAGSFYQLGRLQQKKNDFNARNEALENFKQAALREPGNIQYRLDYASFLEEFAINSAVSSYKQIIEDFPRNPEAVIRMGEIKLKNYNEYKNSKKIGSETEAWLDFDLAEYAEADFNEAEQYFLKALKIDPANEKAFFGLSRLYENAGYSDRTMFLLEKIISVNPANNNAHLLLGMLYHRKGDENKANDEFGKALNLMSYDERDDFIYNSAVLILTPVYGDELKDYSREQIEKLIERFWKISNPLLLSDQNERLLEHYSRMAYANLYFGLADTPGWKTDRGEVLLRFGLPAVISKTRPYISGDGMFFSKNEVWQYDYLSLSFDDYNMSGNFKLSWDRGQAGRFGSNPRSSTASYESFNALIKRLCQIYIPKKELLNVNMEIYCFRNPDTEQDKNDYYTAFELPVRDTTGKLIAAVLEFEAGVFVLDEEHNPLFEKKTKLSAERIEKIVKSETNKSKVDNIKFNIPPGAVSFAFEIRNRQDSTFFSYHSVIPPPVLRKAGTDLSGILFASEITAEKEIPGAIKRNNLYIVPKVKRAFYNDEPLYIYYEVYNLAKNDKGMTDFEQIITVEGVDKEKGAGLLSGFIKGITNFFSESNSKVSLSSSYQTSDTSPQQFVQLDFGRYLPGTYKINLLITDKISGAKEERNMEFEILNKSGK